MVVHNAAALEAATVGLIRRRGLAGRSCGCCSSSRPSVAFREPCFLLSCTPHTRAGAPSRLSPLPHTWAGAPSRRKPAPPSGLRRRASHPTVAPVCLEARPLVRSPPSEAVLWASVNAFRKLCRRLADAAPLACDIAKAARNAFPFACARHISGEIFRSTMIPYQVITPGPRHATPRHTSRRRRRRHRPRRRHSHPRPRHSHRRPHRRRPRRLPRHRLANRRPAHRLPHHTTLMPRHATPRLTHAAPHPRHTTPHHTHATLTPRHAPPATPSTPRHTNHATPRQPRQATPRHATPRHATPVLLVCVWKPSKRL